MMKYHLYKSPHLFRADRLIDVAMIFRRFLVKEDVQVRFVNRETLVDHKDARWKDPLCLQLRVVISNEHRRKI